MMRNGCLTLCQFSIPTDVVRIHQLYFAQSTFDRLVPESSIDSPHFSFALFQLFEYERLVKILLHGVSDSEQEGFVQRIAIYLLNSLACLVDGRQKLFLGDLGAIGVSFFDFLLRVLLIICSCFPLWCLADDVNTDPWSPHTWSIRRCHGSRLVNDVECHRRDSDQLWTVFGRARDGILSRMFECMYLMLEQGNPSALLLKSMYTISAFQWSGRAAAKYDGLSG